MTTKPKRVDFDAYADQYEVLLQEQLAFFSRDRGYFSEYKVALAAEHMATQPARILDFGCGIGLSLPFLASYFPSSQLYATDLSEKSLEHVRKNFPKIIALADSDIDVHEFDMIFVTGVFHHIPPEQRASVMRRLSSLLAAGGRLLVFEHNLFNPITRHMVATCPFDEDAQLLTMNTMKCLCENSGQLTVLQNGYCLFFPQMLAVCRPLERFMRRLPLGGQYFVVGGK